MSGAFPTTVSARNWVRYSLKISLWLEALAVFATSFMIVNSTLLPDTISAKGASLPYARSRAEARLNASSAKVARAPPARTPMFAMSERAVRSMGPRPIGVWSGSLIYVASCLLCGITPMELPPGPTWGNVGVASPVRRQAVTSYSHWDMYRASILISAKHTTTDPALPGAKTTVTSYGKSVRLSPRTGPVQIRANRIRKGSGNREVPRNTAVDLDLGEPQLQSVPGAKMSDTSFI